MKRLILSVVMLAVALAGAAPAYAQEVAAEKHVSGDASNAPPGASSDVVGTVTEISGSVVLVEEDPSSDSGDKGYFTVTDETEISKQEDGEVVRAAFEDLAVGQTVEAAYAGPVMESYPPQGEAASIAILEETGPPPGRSAKLSFELAVACEPPAGATFFGNVRLGEGGPGIFAELLDPDGDGLYVGVATLPDRFAPGPAPEGTEPVSLPVRVVRGTGTRSAGAGTLPGEPTSVVKDFGAVPMEAENEFHADASFCDDGNGPVGSGDANDDEGGDVSGGGGALGGMKTLPATGGAWTIAGLTGLVLIAGGLLARRKFAP